VFDKPDFLKRLMPLLVRHGLLSFSSADVLQPGPTGATLRHEAKLPAERR